MRNEEKRKLAHYGYYRFKIAEQRTIEITKENIDSIITSHPSVLLFKKFCYRVLV